MMQEYYTCSRVYWGKWSRITPEGITVNLKVDLNSDVVILMADFTTNRWMNVMHSSAAKTKQLLFRRNMLPFCKLCCNSHVKVFSLIKSNLALPKSWSVSVEIEPLQADWLDYFESKCFLGVVVAQSVTKGNRFTNFLQMCNIGLF